MESQFLEYGVLGAILLISLYANKRQYDDNQKLHEELREILSHSSDQVQAVQEKATTQLVGVITTVTEQQEQILSSQAKIVESLSVQEYVAQKLNELYSQRPNNSKEDTGANR